MKNILLKSVMVVVAAAMTYNVAAQQNYGLQWGADPAQQEENVKHYNFLKDAYNNKDYDEALEYIPDLIEKAPKSTQNLYIYAIEIYKDKIVKASSLAEKNEAIDKLMELYDLRAEHFGDDPKRGKAYILALKANDFARYKPMDRENMQRFYQEAIKAGGEDVETDLLVIYFSELTNDYLDDSIESDDYLNEYDKVEAIMKLPKNDDKVQDRNSIEALFLKSGAANCENIEKMFSARIAEDPENIEVLEKAAGLLTRGNCKGEFYFSVAEKLYNLNPSANTAMILAAGYEEKGDNQKALEYLNAAMSVETDPEAKVNLALRIAGAELASKNARSAANFAKQAIDLSSDNGFAYYILAQAYASGANQCTDFNRQSVFWLAYDTLLTAKRLLGGEEAKLGINIDSQLAAFRGNFPTKKEGFFRELTEGQSYRVNCGWVSGSTTARFRD